MKKNESLILKFIVPLIFFFFIFSTKGLAYQVFTNNSNMNGTHYFSVLDLGYNMTDQMCMNVTSSGSALNFTNLYCPDGTLSGYLFSVQPLSTDDWLQTENQSLSLDYWYNQTKAFSIPAGKQVIILVQYDISNNSGITHLVSALHWGFFGGSAGSQYVDVTNGLHTAVAYVNATNVSRKFAVSFDLGFNSSFASGMSITISKFWVYTMDMVEVRTDWTNDPTTEMTRYCGSGFTQDLRPAVQWQYYGYPAYYRNEYFTNNTYDFAFDVNGLHCGIIRLHNMVIARHWDFEELNAYSNPDGVWFFFTPEMFFIHEERLDLNVLFEKFTKTQVKMTMLSNSSGADSHTLFDDYLGTQIDFNSFVQNYSTAFRQTIDLLGNPKINISNQNPAGGNFSYGAVGTYPIWYYAVWSNWHPFFTSDIHVDNAGWSCSVVRNTEFFVTSGGDVENEHWCGDCDCAGDGLGYRCNQGSDHWVCYNAYEAWHYDDVCTNDIKLICDIRCESGQCVGEKICANTSDCTSYCDGSILHYGAYCDYSSFTCKWYSSQNCTYGCNSYLNECNTQPPAPPVFTNQTTQGIISEISGGVLGFLSGSGGSIFKFLFFLFVVVVIIALFGMVGYIVKKAFGG